MAPMGSMRCIQLLFAVLASFMLGCSGRRPNPVADAAAQSPPVFRATYNSDGDPLYPPPFPPPSPPPPSPPSPPSRVVFGSHHRGGNALIRALAKSLQDQQLCNHTTVETTGTFDATQRNLGVEGACAVFHIMRDPIDMVVSSYLQIKGDGAAACGKGGKTGDCHGWYDKGGRGARMDFDQKSFGRQTYGAFLKNNNASVGLPWEAQRLVQFELKDMLASYELLLPRINALQICLQDVQDDFDRLAKALADKLNQCGCSIDLADAPFLLDAIRTEKLDHRVTTKWWPERPEVEHTLRELMYNTTGDDMFYLSSLYTIAKRLPCTKNISGWLGADDIPYTKGVSYYQATPTHPYFKYPTKVPLDPVKQLEAKKVETGSEIGATEADRDALTAAKGSAGDPEEPASMEVPQQAPATTDDQSSISGASHEGTPVAAQVETPQTEAAVAAPAAAITKASPREATPSVEPAKAAPAESASIAEAAPSQTGTGGGQPNFRDRGTVPRRAQPSGTV